MDSIAICSYYYPIAEKCIGYVIWNCRRISIDGLQFFEILFITQ